MGDVPVTRIDGDSVVTAVAIVVVILALLVAGFLTARSNGEITERLATVCMENGGTWQPSGDWGDDEGCVR